VIREHEREKIMLKAGKHLLLLTVAAAFLVGAAACGSGGEEEAATAQPDPNNPTKVSVGYIPIFIYAPYYIAIEKGYFREQGIEIELQALQGGAQILTQVVTGNLDTGGGGIGPAALNLAKETLDRGNRELPFVIVSPLHIERPPLTTSLVVSPRAYDSGAIRSIADLKGRKVATNDRGAATSYWIGLALARANLTFRDLAGGEPVEVGFAAMPAALERGDIDAAVLGEPLLSAAIKAGTVRVLSDDFLDGEQPTAIFLNREWARKNPRLAEGYVAALLKAFRDLDGDGWRQEENLAIISKYTNNFPIADLKAANRPFFEPNGAWDLARLEKQQRYYLENSTLLTYKEPLDVKLLLDTSYAEKAVRALGPAR
jgi:NitT/TauT family transport system substrate-binding protein